MSKRVLVGMSGGLDSTYAAYLLKQAGYEVEGAVLSMHEYTDLVGARRSAALLGIPLHVVDATGAFDRSVKPYLAGEYAAGRTPNPCVICNSEVKFRLLYDRAMAGGFDWIATGHYAVTDEGGGLACGRDEKKDQSYMLWRVPAEILARLLLPLGRLEKERIRAWARGMGWEEAEKKESQEICFLPDGNPGAFVEEFFGKPSKKGSFVDINGNVLGEHKGIVHYTVGQRKGLGIALGARMFVTAIDPIGNTVTLSADPNVCTDRFFVTDMCFLGEASMNVGECLPLRVKIRSQAPKEPCCLTYLGGGRAAITAERPLRAVTPGQSAVFYERAGTGVVCGGFLSISV